MGQTRNIPQLVRKVRALQRDEGLTLADMAARLKVSPSMLAMVYRGHRSPGRKFLRGLLRAYPRLRDDVHLFLLRDMNNSEWLDTLW